MENYCLTLYLNKKIKIFLCFYTEFVIFFTSVWQVSGSSSINRKTISNNFGGVV
jgi:hypothetical protein